MELNLIWSASAKRSGDDAFTCGKVSRALLLSSVLFGIISLAGCVRFHPEPLSPEKSAAELENRSLTNAALKQFLAKNLQREPGAWDFETLTLAAFYYHPDLAVARAQWNV